MLDPLAKAVEHLVQGRPEAGDLVAGRRHWQALLRHRRRDVGGPRAHRLDRPQRRGSDPVPAIDAKSKRHRPADQQQLQEVGQGLVAGLGVGADDDDPALVFAANRDHEQFCPVPGLRQEDVLDEQGPRWALAT